MSVHPSLIHLSLQLYSRQPFNKELLQPAEKDAYGTQCHTRVTMLNESHIWCPVYFSLPTDSIAGYGPPHTLIKQSGIGLLIHISCIFYFQSTLVKHSLQIHHLKQGLHLPPYTYSKRMTIWNPSIRKKPLALLSSCLSLRVFIWAVKTMNSLPSEMSPL